MFIFELEKLNKIYEIVKKAGYIEDQPPSGKTFCGGNNIEAVVGAAFEMILDKIKVLEEFAEIAKSDFQILDHDLDKLNDRIDDIDTQDSYY